MPQDVPPAGSRSRASDSSEETRHTPSSNADKDPQPPSSKPGWAEEGGNGWQGGLPNYQVDILKCSLHPAKHVETGGKKRPKLLENNNAHVALGKTSYTQVLSVDHCVVVYCVCLYLGAQAWIGWSSGAVLPPTPAAPWTRALLLFSTGRPLVVGS